MSQEVNIKEKIKFFRSHIPENVEIVAVSKFHPAEMIREAYEAGQRLFGESRVQEFLEKESILPSDIKWHFIGHLQTNKVKLIIGKVFLIESIDSIKLLELIEKESEKAGVETNVLLQVHVAAEEAKFGFYPEELKLFFKEGKYKALKFTKICGLMGMATNTDNENRIKNDFALLYSLFEEMKTNYGEELPNFKYLSMGMSGDWELAVKEGSNIVRIGSAIFGNREY